MSGPLWVRQQKTQSTRFSPNDRASTHHFTHPPTHPSAHSPIRPLTHAPIHHFTEAAFAQLAHVTKARATRDMSLEPPPKLLRLQSAMESSPTRRLGPDATQGLSPTRRLGPETTEGLFQWPATVWETLQSDKEKKAALGRHI